MTARGTGSRVRSRSAAAAKRARRCGWAPSRAGPAREAGDGWRPLAVGRVRMPPGGASVKVLPRPGALSSDRSPPRRRARSRGDREPETRAAILSVGRAVGLAEGLEDRLVLLGWECRSPVSGDVEGDPRSPAAAHDERDPAELGELERVRQQVLRDLLEALESVSIVAGAGHRLATERRCPSRWRHRRNDGPPARRGAAPARPPPAARPACRLRSWKDRGCR